MCGYESTGDEMLQVAIGNTNLRIRPKELKEELYRVRLAFV
jgi:hypothetical protein